VERERELWDGCEERTRGLWEGCGMVVGALDEREEGEEEEEGGWNQRFSLREGA